MTIYHYNLAIYQKPTKYYSSEDIFIVEEKKILAENDRYIVFDDPFFTKIEKAGEGYIYSKLNRENISFKTCLNEKGVFYSIYTDRKIRASTIESHIRAKAKEEYGYLFSDELNLDILKNGGKSE